MWKSTCSLMFLEGGVVAEVLHEYVPSIGQGDYYPPYLRRRIFVKRDEAVHWVSFELEQFDPAKYQDDQLEKRLGGMELVGEA